MTALHCSLHPRFEMLGKSRRDVDATKSRSFGQSLGAQTLLCCRVGWRSPRRPSPAKSPHRRTLVRVLAEAGGSIEIEMAQWLIRFRRIFGADDAFPVSLGETRSRSSRPRTSRLNVVATAATRLRSRRRQESSNSYGNSMNEGKYVMVCSFRKRCERRQAVNIDGLRAWWGGLALD